MRYRRFARRSVLQISGPRMRTPGATAVNRFFNFGGSSSKQWNEAIKIDFQRHNLLVIPKLENGDPRRQVRANLRPFRLNPSFRSGVVTETIHRYERGRMGNASVHGIIQQISEKAFYWNKINKTSVMPLV